MKGSVLSKHQSAPVNEILPIGQMILYGLQHVLVMYAGAVAVPLVIGNAVGLPVEQIILLISTDLFICGIATIAQSFGFGAWIGCRLPLVQGCTFAALVPMMLIGKQYGISGISGAVIIAGLFTLICAPWICHLVRFFPKVVMGSIVTLIGLSLTPVAGNWIISGNSGSILPLVMAALTLIIILHIYHFMTGMIKNIAVLLGLIGGTVIWSCFLPLDFHFVNSTPWVNFPQIMWLAKPEFHIVPVALLSMVMVVVMIETMSSMMIIGDMVDKKADATTLRNGLNACGIATMVGGLFNLFPYAAFAQNVGLIGLTGVRSRFVVSVSGVLLILMGMFAKMAALVVAIPKPILGGAGVIMFGMVAVSGIRTLSSITYRHNNNEMVVALTLALGLMPIMVPQLFEGFPSMMQMFLHSGITIGTVIAILANLTLNKASSTLMEETDPSSANMSPYAPIRAIKRWLLLRKTEKNQEN
ncbi:nucleobase:cation symporter-2 family protein [Candidatus Arsenophonus nilaparvatae]|uniref:nucleobase:cation symporter-2 family protein n=1 Tax=Candidatus Arsenophonus nilaparvatae TaxID=1247023 RepID=UPI0005099F70|nr:nucleobase:cation symporter-2 family protein [Candidatus Arsenophonus nilaparvatae]